MFDNCKYVIEKNQTKSYRNGKKRVAICFSGLVKNYWDNLHNFKENIIDTNHDCDVDIFFDVWDVLDTRFIDQYSRDIYIIENDIKSIFEVFNSDNIINKLIRVQKFVNQDTSVLLKYAKYGDTHHMAPNGDHVVAMFYKIKQCNDMKLVYEKNGQFIYDLVLRTRLDLQFQDKIIFNTIDSNIINIPGIVNEARIFADHFAISSSHNINYLSGLWDNIENIANTYEVFNPHKLLFYHLKNKCIKNLNVRNFAPRVNGEVVKFWIQKFYCTFGIITSGQQEENINKIIDSIEMQNIPNYEIIIIGNCNIDRTNTTVYDFDETIRDKWITRKKNIITQHARYENIVYLHDYIVLEPGWYEGFSKFGEFDIASNIILDSRGERQIDWSLWYEDILFCYDKSGNDTIETRKFLLPYDVTDLSKAMYLSGSYWVAKTNIMKEFTLNESLCWGQAEDVNWSKQVRQKYNFSFNPNSTVRYLKEKENQFSLTTPEIIQAVRNKLGTS